MSIDLSNRVCVITGAGQGIGDGVARGFARRGATVVATDLEPPGHDDVALNLSWDVAQPDRAGKLVDQVVKQFGRLDVLVANAGIFPRQSWDEISLEDWRRVLAVNLDGVWHGARAAAHPMTEAGYGKIITVSSVEVVMGVAVHAHYDASKAGVVGLTRSLARALGPRGVRVNAVVPGAIQTPGELSQFPDQAAVEAEFNKRQCIPGRLTPEMIEPVFAFLASAESDSMTGQCLTADQGLIHW